jgi:ribosomal protein RSM22 (predicted rRNA methylase)
MKKTKEGDELTLFSYVAIRRGPRAVIPEETSRLTRQGALAWPRLVDQPKKRGGHVHMSICTSNGTFDLFQ